MRNKMTKKHVSMTLMGLILGGNSQAYAVNLNYENLSFLEEPIAVHVGDTTLDLNGLVDAAVDADLGSDSDSDTDAVLTSSFQVTAETQLANSLTVGAAYLGEYVVNDDNDYNDNVAVFVSGIWGEVSLGDVTGIVQEETGRELNVGNGELNFDQQLGGLEDKGITYTGRLGPSRYALTVDEDENFSIGTFFQRPIGNRDYLFSLNYRDSQYNSSDGSVEFDSKGLVFVAALTYGSTVYDFGLGLEDLSSDSINVDRAYASIGVAHKIGVVAFSAEAHLGDIDGQDEVSFALGASYDIARGTSLNLGVNHSDSQVTIDGVDIVNADDTSAILSLTYRY